MILYYFVNIVLLILQLYIMDEINYDKLIKAYTNGNIEIIKYYTKHCDIPINLYIEILRIACYYGYSNIVEYILKYNIKSNNNILILGSFSNLLYLFEQAGRRNNIYILKYLFEYIIKYNIASYYSKENVYRGVFNEIFFVVIDCNILSIIKYIIELYDKYNININMFLCCSNIMFLWGSCAKQDNTICKYLININKHNYNYVKYIHFNSIYIYCPFYFNNGNIRDTKWAMPYLMFSICNKKNILKYSPYGIYIINNNRIKYGFAHFESKNYLIDYVVCLSI